MGSGVIFVGGSGRPIDKVLPCLNMVNLDSTQQVQDLVTAATACTATGIRWSFDINASHASTAVTSVAWAIVILRDGRTANTLAISAGSNLYEPEQDVLAFGRGTVMQSSSTAGPKSVHFEGDTKTMRKLKIGDKLTFIALGEATNVTELLGTVQVFCRF